MVDNYMANRLKCTHLDHVFEWSHCLTRAPWFNIFIYDETKLALEAVSTSAFTFSPFAVHRNLGYETSASELNFTERSDFRSIRPSISSLLPKQCLVQWTLRRNLPLYTTTYDFSFNTVVYLSFDIFRHCNHRTFLFLESLNTTIKNWIIRSLLNQTIFLCYFRGFSDTSVTASLRLYGLFQCI